MPPSPITPAVESRGPGTGLALLVGVFVTLAVATAALLLRDGYRDTVANAAQDVRNLVALMRNDVAGKLLAVDGALIETARDAADTADAAAAERLADRMTERARFLGLIDAMAFVAPDTLRADIATARWGTADIAGRGFVAAFARDPSRRFHIGRPMNEAGLAGQMLHVARRVDRPDGTFGGIVVARLTAGALVSGTTLQSFDGRLSIDVRRDDGALLGRSPLVQSTPADGLDDRRLPTACGETGPIATIQQDPLSIGAELIEACARVTGFPLMVAAALDYEPAVRRWRTNAAVLVVLVVGAIVVVLMLARAIRRRYDATARTAMETRELATSMMTSAPIAVLISELGTRRLLDANDQARRLLALGDGPLGSFDVEDLAADRGVARAIGRRVWHGESLINEEVELCDRNGGRHWTMVSIRRFEHPSGPRALIVLADVTQLKRATEEAVESRRLLRTVVDAMPARITYKGLDRHYILVNDGFARQFGMTPEAMIGRQFSDLVDAEIEARSDALDQETLATGRTPATQEWSQRQADGTMVELATVRAPHLDADGRPLGVVAVSLDVTEYRAAIARAERSERLLQATLDAIPVVVLVKDAQQRYLLVNRETERFYGIDRNRIVGSTLREVARQGYYDPLGARGATSDARLAEIEASDRDVLASGRNSPPREYETRRADGAVRTHVVIRSPLGSDRAGLVTMAFDVTDLKNAQRALSEAKEHAEFANRAKSEFLANMSHELRTPLNAVIGFSQMIQAETFGPLNHPRYREYVGYVADSAQHLLELINDILDVSSIDLGQVELSEDLVELDRVAAACLTLLGGRAEQNSLTLVATGLKGLPALRGDRRRILQILVNLVTNAVKFTPSGGRVEISGALGPGGELVLKVADTGIGMRPEDVETALQPFRQIENVLVKTVGGTGLGLAIVQRLTRLHGARLSIDTAPGRGTAVSIAFPAERTAVAKAA